MQVWPELFCQTPDSELKSVGALESSLQERTSFIVEDDSYIFNGFREWNRDIWCLHLLLSERPPVCPGDDQGAGANRVQTEALCIWSGCLARSLCVVHQWRTYREEVSEPWLLWPAVSVVEHYIHFTMMSAAWCQWKSKNPHKCPNGVCFMPLAQEGRLRHSPVCCFIVFMREVPLWWCYLCLITFLCLVCHM